MFNFLNKKDFWLYTLWCIIVSVIVFVSMFYVLPQSKELFTKIWIKKFELISAASGVATVLLLGWTILDARGRSKIDNQRFLFESDPHVIVDFSSSQEKDYIYIKNVGKGAACNSIIGLVNNFDEYKEIGIFGLFDPRDSFITDIKLEEIGKVLNEEKVPDHFKINIKYYSPYNNKKYSQNFAIKTEKHGQNTNAVVKSVAPLQRIENKNLNF